MVRNKFRLLLAILALVFITMSCASSKKYKGGGCPTFSSLNETVELNARG
ncbi:MAG: hypothetical protein KAG84_07365 [Bacteroidales bacterium]|nr:hypothetical protein [Bacteroidales bacterium]